MNLLKTLIFSLCAFAGPNSFAAEFKFESPNDLNDFWQEEEIYFQPKNPQTIGNWTGKIYHYGSEKCFDLIQNNDSKIASSEMKCESVFLKKATEPYTRISDFETYKSKLLLCLEKFDQGCLRGLISKTFQISFGFDGFQDRRDYIFANWKKKDFERLHDAIKQGCVGKDESRTFPPHVKNKGLGYRGEFKKENGSWLLKSFVAGD